MLTKEHIEKIEGLRTIRDKSYMEGREYLHGFIYGLDCPAPYPVLSVQQDTTEYNAVVLDARLRESLATGEDRYPLSKILVENPAHPVLLDRIKSSSPQEIETFIQKWLDKDFKFA